MIFGIQSGQILYNEQTIDLDRMLISPEFLQSAEIDKRSIINGTKIYIKSRDYSEFTITVYLEKYINSKAKLQELLSVKNKYVNFRPHKDGDYIKNIHRSNAEFYISKIFPYYLMQPDFYDCVNIVIKPADYVDLSTSIYYQGYGRHYGRIYGKGF